MDLQAVKIELAKLILNLDNPSLVKKIRDLLLKESGDFWTNLSEQEKEEIRLGIKQLDEGQRISFDEFLKRVS